MSTMNQYELLKKEGIWNDRVKYVLSLSDKTELENYLKQSSCYDDIQILIFLSKLTKNEKNLFEIFQTDSFPIRQRIKAGICWLTIQNDEKSIYEFIINIMDNKNLPRIFKSQLLKTVHHLDCLKKSPSFFYNLACYLTKSYRHDQYNLDAYLVPFCSQDQIINLLSQWSIKQIDSSSLFFTKLIFSQPLIFLQLNKKFSIYSYEDNDLLSKLADQQPKVICRLMVDYLNQLDKHQRFLPYFIYSKQKYFFKKAPDEMIELITMVAANQPGSIKYRTSYYTGGHDLAEFFFPRSFSLQHYVRLFIALYDTCQWSLNHTIDIFRYMLAPRNEHIGLSSVRKQRKWLVDIVINQHIGREVFFQKLLEEGTEKTLELFEDYTELTTPLSVHLISQYEMKQILPDKKRLPLIRYQSMTKRIFHQFIDLFSKTNTNVHQREQNYILFLQCAVSTHDDEQVTNVLQWIEKRLMNERLYIIECFLESLTKYNNRFHLEILPKNLQTIKSIIDIAYRHLQRSTSTLQIIINYAVLLLQRVESHSDKQIQLFACQNLEQCFLMNNCQQISIPSSPLAYPTARQLFADILTSNLYTNFLSKSMLDELNDSIDWCFEKPWSVPPIDLFLHSFFYDRLPSSKELQLSFKIDKHLTILSTFLKNRSTQYGRVKHLINNLDQSFFINQTVQKILLRSQEYRHMIDQLIEDDRCVTVENLSNKNPQFILNLQTTTKNMKLIGLHVQILNSSCRYLTGNQQEHITKIILNDYLQDKEVINLNKLKSLRVLRRLTHTYPITLQWFEQKQGSIFAVQGNPDTSSYRGTRGANAQAIDDIILCLPATFDLPSADLLKYFHFLKTKINAANAKYVSDALRIISRQISDEIFLKYYLELIHSEQFQKLGITAKKEILRLLTEYTFDSSLISSVIKPFWDSRPHQDVRACLTFTLLYFLDKLQNEEEKNIMWKIFEEAADDSYLLVVQSFFPAGRGKSRWPLTQLIHSSNETIFREFINRIQLKILDHPISIEARSWAWTNISSKYCDAQILIGKAKQLCLQFDKNANILWEQAFNQLIFFTKQQTINESSENLIIDLIKQLISCREEIDSKANGIDNQHDLPVYRRIRRILNNLIQRINEFNDETKHSFRSLGSIILQFDQTLAPVIGALLLKIAQNRDDLQSLFVLFRENLPQIYFERVLIQFTKILSNQSSCPFIQRLDTNEKFDLAQWFFKEKDCGLLAFDLLKKQVFKRANIDREQCQNLLRQMRQSENLLLREQALRYTVPWKAKKKKKQSQRKAANRTATNDPSNPETSDMNLFDIFGDHQS